jgi:hypothetical protein
MASDASSQHASAEKGPIAARDLTFLNHALWESGTHRPKLKSSPEAVFGAYTGSTSQKELVRGY